jgi:hypothetical protein
MAANANLVRVQAEEERGENLIQQAIREIGRAPLARACGVTYPSVFKWLASGRLPRTELTDETDYCSKIEALTRGKYTREALRDCVRRAWAQSAQE